MTLQELDLVADIDLGAEISAAIETKDSEKLNAIFEPMAMSDGLRELLELTVDDRSLVLTLLSAELAAALIEEAPHEMGADLMEDLEPTRAFALMEEMDSDVQANLIGDMDDEEAEAILSQMDASDAADMRRLSEYESDTAGGLMMSELFTFKNTQTVGAVLKELASEDADVDRYRGNHPYIIDKENKPVGVVSLRGLLSTSRTTRLTSIMVEPMTVEVSTTLFELADLFDKYPFLGLPVIETDGTLVGVVSRASVSQALLEQAESENLKLQGVVGDELHSMPTWLRSKRRLAWLSANIVLNIIAASVISAYEETLIAVIAIAVFLPMVSDMSGCSGNQAVGVTMRELSLGLVRPVDAFKVWMKEISVGIINGIALGILIGLVAWVWKGNPALGLVIGLALALNTMLAVSIGGVVPLLLKRMGQDPAVASGPLLTTVTDMAGFFLVLSLATLFMPWLV
ncbi:magnesium transporter [bacterium]|nr:magnesium transporter [bacterium]